MNDIYEIWSLPWHELQKSLAGGMGALGAAEGANPRSAAAQRNAAGTRDVGGRRNAAGFADSWLKRARGRGAPLTTL
jgi:hypothetical protein